MNTVDSARVAQFGRESARGQTPITVTGLVDGDELTLSFIERGARRSTQGTFKLMRDTDGTLRGRFMSEAAKSAGSRGAPSPVILALLRDFEVLRTRRSTV